MWWTARRGRGDDRAVSGDLLFGRDAESGVIGALTERLDAGGAALVLTGGPGVGKSVLISEGMRRARENGCTVLGAVGVQTEANLAFAGLHQVLSPVLAGAAELPAPQRAALEAAFGESDAAVPDAFLIALAALSLLSDAAARAPVLVVIEEPPRGGASGDRRRQREDGLGDPRWRRS